MAYGDTAPKQVNVVTSVVDLPIVEQALIADVADPINIALLSGKKAGSCVIMQATADDALTLCIASGSAPAAPWFTLAAAGELAITPA